MRHILPPEGAHSAKQARKREKSRLDELELGDPFRAYSLVRRNNQHAITGLCDDDQLGKITSPSLLEAIVDMALDRDLAGRAEGALTSPSVGRLVAVKLVRNPAVSVNGRRTTRKGTYVCVRFKAAEQVAPQAARAVLDGQRMLGLVEDQANWLESLVDDDVQDRRAPEIKCYFKFPAEASDPTMIYLRPPGLAKFRVLTPWPKK